MPDGDRIKTFLSDEGQVLLPAALRDRHGWTAGTELVIEDGPNGVTLRAANPSRRDSPFPPTRLEDVAGMLKRYYDGPPKTIEEMHEAITQEVLARHARGRY